MDIEPTPYNGRLLVNRWALGLLFHLLRIYSNRLGLSYSI